MNIDRIHNNLYPDKFQDKNDKAQKLSDKAESQKTNSKGDKLEISEQAKKLNGNNALLKTAASHFAKIPDIRQAKVDEIKGKVANQYYNQEEVISDIANKLASSEELKATLESENKEAAKASPEDLKKLTVIMNRVERGFYKNIEVLDKVAKGILNDLKNQS